MKQGGRENLKTLFLALGGSAEHFNVQKNFAGQSPIITCKPAARYNSEPASPRGSD